MFIHNISRIAFEIGPVTVRWYGLTFALGCVLYYVLTRKLWKLEGASEGGNGGSGSGGAWALADFDTLVIYLFIGLVVGARLGEVLFYHPSYYLGDPVEILKIWKGGLSSHGATIGLLIAYSLFWLRHGRRAVGVLKYADVLAICMPLVAGFVRIGNFFNSEIVGRAFDGPWAVVFAQNGESFGRHPVQLYEGAWAWAVFAVLMGLWLWKGARARGGWVGSGIFVFLFVGLYFSGRFLIEFFKEYQVGVGSDGLPWGVTMGQALSVVPILIAIAGIGWVVVKLRREKS